MADEIARFKQYEYRANSNLVLQSTERRDRSHEATGEPESLWGKIEYKFGDRALAAAPTSDKVAKMRKRAASQMSAAPKRKARGGEAKSVLQASISNAGVGYRPKTKETQRAYEALLSVIARQVGDVPNEMLAGFAEEILFRLKNDAVAPLEKRRSLEKEVFQRSLNEDTFNSLNAFSQKITDFVEDIEDAAEEDKMDDEFGVSLVFEDDDALADDDDDAAMGNYEIRDGSDDEDASEDMGVAAPTRGTGVTDMDQDAPTLAASGLAGDEEGTGALSDNGLLDPNSVDAHWLQRQVSKIITDDAIEAKKLSSQIFAILETAQDARVCENDLLTLLQYEQFDFIKLLCVNRKTIVFCTRLLRAGSDGDARAAVEAEMRDDPELAIVLDKLQHKRVAGERSGPKGALGAMAAEAQKGRDATAAADAAAKQNSTASQLKTLDIESMAFTQGGHLMSNKKCIMPPNSVSIQGKGYTTVHIPARVADVKKDEKLVPIKQLPEWARNAFKGMTSFNRIQSKVYDTAFNDADNLLMCAPTGAGKTNVAMLTIMHELAMHRNPEDGTVNLAEFKVVYVAPMKALVQEVVQNFSNRLKDYNIVVRELSGDQQLTKAQIEETQIIVTTPEKWDIITRRSGERTYTQLVRLVIIDEIHLLHDDRGPVLESIVARTIRQIEATQEMVRLVGLSATLPNYEDVATFLRVRPEHVFYFDNSYRPVPLQQTFIGITEKKGLKRFNLMNQICYEKVAEHALTSKDKGKQGSQVLVFVHSRKETARTARMLKEKAEEADQLDAFVPERSSAEILRTEAEKMQNADLKELLPYGFAVHHAGLSKVDRTLIEDLYADGHIRVLASTATLAWGVNLPAHAVIIKGTQWYNPEKGMWSELSMMDILQMLGRAGRPAFDKTGEGIIITSQTEMQFYLSLLNQQLPIESQFMSRMADQMNGEIVLGTVTNVRDAVEWLGYTYLYICMLRNPTLYQVSYDVAESDPLLKQRRADLVHTAAALLDKSGLIKYDKRTGAFRSTDVGRVAAHFYVSYRSMSTYNEHLKPSMSDIELLRLFSLSDEFKSMSVRQEERMELSKLLLRVPIPVKEGVEEATAKVNVLLQTYISRLKMDGFALVADMVYVTQSAGRIIRALFEMVLKRGWAQLAARVLTLSKMIDHRQWNTMSSLRQFKDVPAELVKRLEAKDFALDKLYELNSQELGALVRFPAKGNFLFKRIHMCPRVALAASVQPLTRSVLRVELAVTPDFEYDYDVHGGAVGFWITVEDVDGEHILHHEFLSIKKRYAQDEHILTFTVPLFDPLPPQYFVRASSDRWLVPDALLPLSFRHLLLPERFPPATELLDMQPIDAGRPDNFSGRKNHVEFFKSLKIRQFNAIQTQTFKSLYTTDDNVLIAAPAGSGLSVCGELAMLKLFGEHEDATALAKSKGSKRPAPARTVYVVAQQDLAERRYAQLSARFAKLDKKVGLLGEDSAANLRLLKENDVVVCTAQRWDVVSRRWRQRKNVQNVRLYVFDQMQLLGGSDGPTLEVVVSRARYVAAQTEKPTRIVALSTSLANARTVGEWIGAPSRACFNFHPNVRPVPLQVQIQGFDAASQDAMLLSMAKPAVTAVRAHAGRDPVLMFVPDRKTARSLARDLITFADAATAAARAANADADAMAEDTATVIRPFLHCKVEALEPYLEHVKVRALREALQFGVGFFHEALSKAERKVVSELYSKGALQVVVATHGMAYKLPTRARTVVVVGTQTYDGREHRYVDVPITQLLHVVGKAGRQGIDQSGRFTLLCHNSKKAFYKKFLYDPLPVESHLDQVLADHFNAEVVTKTIESKQAAVDYLTWTFFYRRLTQNPNYYGLETLGHQSLSDHLSTLVEATLEDLEQSKCVSIDDDEDEVAPLNLGMIASYYYIRYTTIELFALSLKRNTKLRGLLQIVAEAAEYDDLAVRRGDERDMRRLAKHVPLKMEADARYNDPHTKTNLLLQAHFDRKQLLGDLARDQDVVLLEAPKLIQAMVDVISSSGWLLPALAAMELSQMVTQAMWESDSPLMQLPHITRKLAKSLTDAGVEGVFDLLDLEEDDRRSKLQSLSKREYAELAIAANRYPSVDVAYEVQEAEELHAGELVTVEVQLEREGDDSEDDGAAQNTSVEPVCAPFFPAPRSESWWLLIGDVTAKTLLTIKRVSLAQTANATLQFVAPAAGNHKLTLYAVCDSYNGCDQYYEFDCKIGEALEEEDSEEEEEEEAMDEDGSKDGARKRRRVE